MNIRVGVLLRHEDESGVSGTGIVADIVEYPDGWCVAHWRSNTPSTNIYPNEKALSAVHSHGGKTEVVWIAEIDAPKDAAHLKEVVEDFREEEEQDEKHDRLVAEVTEEVTATLRDRVAKEAARRAAKTVAKRVAKDAKPPAEETEE